jgi:hypothetical protein
VTKIDKPMVRAWRLPHGQTLHVFAGETVMPTCSRSPTTTPSRGFSIARTTCGSGQLPWTRRTSAALRSENSSSVSAPPA